MCQMQTDYVVVVVVVVVVVAMVVVVITADLTSIIIAYMLSSSSLSSVFLLFVFVLWYCIQQQEFLNFKSATINGCLLPCALWPIEGKISRRPCRAESSYTALHCTETLTFIAWFHGATDPINCVIKDILDNLRKSYHLWADHTKISIASTTHRQTQLSISAAISQALICREW